MRDSEFPSIWGQHPLATFNPVYVRDRLITTVDSAPAEWAARLADLGFTKGSRSWLRLGPVAPSEFEYLSPSIILRSFRADDALNATDQRASNAVPTAVKDQIIAMWQTNLDAVLFELALHGVMDRVAAWTHVESGMEGDETPEADSVIDLAFARMKYLGTLTDSALEFAASRGWEGVAGVPPSPRGRLVAEAGESVSWLIDGDAGTGRLASDIHEGDISAWVYEGGPMFVGGISAMVPGRLPLTALLLSAPMSSEPIQTSGDASVVQSGAVADFDLYEYSQTSKQIVDQFLRTENIRFPQDGWHQIVRSRIRDRSELAQYEDEILEILGHIEGDLAKLTRLYYGGSGVGFCFARDYDEQGERRIALKVGRYNNRGFFASNDFITPIPLDLSSDLIPFTQIARALDEQVREAVQTFKADCARFGAVINVPYALPLAYYLSSRVSSALENVEVSGTSHEITAESLFTVLAVAHGAAAVAQESILRYGDEHSTSIELFNQGVDSATSSYGAILNLSMIRSNTPLVNFQSILERVQGGEFPVSIDAPMTFAMMQVNHPDDTHFSIADNITGLSFYSRYRSALWPCADYDAAHNAMARAINQVEALLGGHFEDEITVARKKLETFPLAPRFYAAVEALRTAPDDRLHPWVENELQRVFKGKFNDSAENFLKRCVTHISHSLRGAQGVVAVLKGGRAGSLDHKGIAPTIEALSQTRDAALGWELIKYKEQYRRRGIGGFIDGIAFADPGLCALLAGDRIAIEKDKAESGGKYVDTGVVAGFAKKDMRGLDSNALAEAAQRMSSEQKVKYLKRELIWPRKSFEEFQSDGLQLRTAIAIDLLWKAMPVRPKSSSIQHVRGFTDYVTGMRDGVLELLERVHAGELQDTAPGSATFDDDQRSMDIEFTRFTHNVTQMETVKAAYGWNDFKMRGFKNATVTWYEPFGLNSTALFRLLRDAKWSDYLKERRVSKPVSGSRVTRGEVIRTGDDYRNGESVVSEDFIKTFGFSGVEYGNWTNQREREKHLNLSYDSMLDFAKLVGWEPMALSLGGRLGLCIGSRGNGGSNAAVAHFEPANYAMNLTKLSGDGSLAHEYWHAVANHFGHIHTGSPQDLLDTFGYRLQKAGGLPTLNHSELREPVRDAFRNLQVAIMRQPHSNGDHSNIEDYTELSDMMKASTEMGSYWATPAEMFARAMEVWVDDQLAFKGHRNDYLIRRGKAGGVYPDAAHLERINQFVTPLIEAIELTVKSVVHPVLGTVDMGVLHSEHQSTHPLSPQDLMDLACTEMDRLFRREAPSLMFTSDKDSRPGLYKAALDLVMLNDRYADRETVYHESWHVCEAKLLTNAERTALADIFAPRTPMAEYVIDAMRGAGLNGLAMASAESSSSEMQAYAFQLWAVGKLDLSSHRLEQFHRVRGFVDGVESVASLLGGGKAKVIFQQFMSGQLAERAELAAAMQGAGATINLLCGNLEPDRPTPCGPRFGMQ